MIIKPSCAQQPKVRAEKILSSSEKNKTHFFWKLGCAKEWSVSSSSVWHSHCLLIHRKMESDEFHWLLPADMSIGPPSSAFLRLREVGILSVELTWVPLTSSVGWSHWMRQPGPWQRALASSKITVLVPVRGTWILLLVDNGVGQFPRQLHQVYLMADFMGVK